MSTNKVYGDKPNTIHLKELETRWDYDDPTYANGITETFSIDASKHSLFGASKVAADITVLNIGGVDEDEDQKSAGIGEDMALAAPDLLACVIAPNPSAFRGFDTLAVDYSGGRRCLATLDLAHVRRAPPSARLRWRDERRGERPLAVGQIAWISQTFSVMFVESNTSPSHRFLHLLDKDG